jgi:hypothetical protein
VHEKNFQHFTPLYIYLYLNELHNTIGAGGRALMKALHGAPDEVNDISQFA